MDEFLTANWKSVNTIVDVIAEECLERRLMWVLFEKVKPEASGRLMLDSVSRTMGMIQWAIDTRKHPEYDLELGKQIDALKNAHQELSFTLTLGRNAE